MQFIAEHKHLFGVESMCQVLTEKLGYPIATSTFYAAVKRPVSARAARDSELVAHLHRLHKDRRRGRGVAGARKMWHLMRREGHQVARCTVERLMRQEGLRGVLRGTTRVITTRVDPGAARPADLVDRDFSASKPNQLWVVDFTYVPLTSGTAFTAFITDVYSRRIVGWRVKNSMPTQLPLDALEMALWVRQRAGQTLNGLIHHSDAGSQYTAIRYSQTVTDAGGLCSIGSVGDSYDNAMAESVNGLYKTECVNLDGPFTTVDALEYATLDWVDYYNTDRLHSMIGYVPPVEYEQRYHEHQQHQDQPLPATAG